MSLPALFVFLLGACVGSFLNVVVYRLPRGESLAWPGSRCPRCATPLKAADNIPLLSYLLLGGRCRYCGVPIPLRYPVVECVGGLIGIAAYLKWGLTVEAVLQAGCLAALIAVALIDLDSFVIPDSLCVAVALGGLTLAIVSPGRETAGSRLFAGALGVGSVWVLALLSHGGMGLGDAKLLGGMGVLLGPRLAALAFLVAVSLGAVVGVCLLLTRMKGRGDPIPFGPFLVMGALVAALSGDQIVACYARTFLGAGQ